MMPRVQEQQGNSREDRGTQEPRRAVVERTTRRSWEEVVTDIPAALGEVRVDSLAQMELSAWLERMGHPVPFRFHVTEFCRASCAARALCLRPELAYVTPCRLVVRGSDEGVTVGVLLPSAAAGLVLRPDDEALPSLLPLVRVMDQVSERLVDRLAEGPHPATKD
ncbi:MAG: DUF302 domain-containing protein [Planctomycetes bacterium]|nr:DUF302 domain-containing protein [Planctomycetota bacterium]